MLCVLHYPYPISIYVLTLPLIFNDCCLSIRVRDTCITSSIRLRIVSRYCIVLFASSATFSIFDLLRSSINFSSKIIFNLKCVFYL